MLHKEEITMIIAVAVVAIVTIIIVAAKK